MPITGLCSPVTVYSQAPALNDVSATWIAMHTQYLVFESQVTGAAGLNMVVNVEISTDGGTTWWVVRAMTARTGDGVKMESAAASKDNTVTTSRLGPLMRFKVATLTGSCTNLTLRIWSQQDMSLGM